MLLNYQQQLQTQNHSSHLLCQKQTEGEDPVPLLLNLQDSQQLRNLQDSQQVEILQCEELIFVSTVEVNEITDVATESEKLTTEESTSEGVTDQIREMATELDEGATVEPIVIMPESDESDTDYKEFIPGEIPDYSGSDNYNDFLPDVNKS